MKIKETFSLRQVAGTWVVLPLAESTLDFNGMLTLNESGLLLWKALETGCDVDSLVKILLDEYDVSLDEAQKDVNEYLEKLDQAGCLDC